MSNATTGSNVNDPTILDRWTESLATELGITAEEIDVVAILDLARLAAHNVARPAAPVTTFMAGYAAGLRGGGRSEADAAINVAADLVPDESRATAQPTAGAPR